MTRLSMGGRADTSSMRGRGARTPIGASGNLYIEHTNCYFIVLVTHGINSKCKQASNTFLNHAIMQSEKVTFGKQIREELGNLSIQWLEDQLLKKNRELEFSPIQK